MKVYFDGSDADVGAPGFDVSQHTHFNFSASLATIHVLEKVVL